MQVRKFRYQTIAPAANSILSIAAAMVAGGIILALIGKDPVAYFYQLFLQGMFTPLGLIETIIHMAPLLIVSTGLLVCFSAGLWNIGADGQFLIGAILAGWLGPILAPALPLPLYLIVLGLVGAAGGMVWIALPAILKARYDMNEIITTMMMTWVAINLVTWLVKGPLKDPTVVPAQTALLPMSARMPMIPLTRIHIGLIIGLIAIVVIHWVLKRTTLGYQFRVVLANKQAAVHSGMNVARLTLYSLLISGGFAGLAGVSDVLAIKGLFQGNWNPAYGLTAVCLVFISRLNGWAIIPLAFFFSFLSVGGEFVARDQGVPIFFVHVLVGLILLFFAASEYLERRRRG